MFSSVLNIFLWRWLTHVFDDIDIENPEELPEDLLEYFGFDEEDLRG